jgi:hypothetical protein
MAMDFGGAGRDSAVVDRYRLAVLERGQQETGPAEIARFRMHDTENECHRDRRIHRIAAVAKHLQTGFRRQFMHACDDGFGCAKRLRHHRPDGFQFESALRPFLRDRQ